MSLLTAILVASLCAIGWINAICAADGILEKLPGIMGWLPDIIFYPLFQCSKCLSFWTGIITAYLIIPTPAGWLVSFAAVGLTTIISHVVTEIN